MRAGEIEQNPTQQVEAASKAVEQEFESIVRFTSAVDDFAGLSLDSAISEERALADLRTRHLGKKSALAGTKKLIGRVSPEERASFGQLVQATESEVLARLDEASQSLGEFINTQRLRRESIEITLRCRRPRS